MRWIPGQQSGDIEDRRGQSGGGFGGRHIGIGGLVVLLVLSVVFKRNFFALLGGGGEGGGGGAASTPSTPQEDSLVKFVSFVLDDAQSTWERLLPAMGVQYHHAKLVLFRDGVESTCGFAESATGPFYCPGDEKVYIDLGFYEDLRDRFGAPGDFAEAYVLAHEIGHHVQKLLGTMDKVHEAARMRPAQANDLSVRTELQADCYAGVWGHTTADRQILEPGDLDEGLRAAASVGDDRLQRMSTGHVSPDAFTHGTSAQRVKWFKRGFESGRLDACDTFSVAD